MRALRVLLALGVLATGCGSARSAPTSAPAPAPANAVAAHVTVLARYPHDPTAFTEGLVFGSRDRLDESSGLYGSSQLRQVDPTTGRIIRTVPLPASMFAEGIAIDRGVIVQLTWQEHVALTYDEATLARRPTTYPVDGQGWGLALDPAHHRWIQSDGTSELTFRRESDFAVEGQVKVTLDGRPLDQLNELEMVGDAVWANVWKTQQIVRIDPSTGRVTETADLAELVPPGITDPDSVLNGVAHRPGDPVTTLWVTGKRWPTMYEISVRP